jgi:hypothetical protein
LAVAQIDDPHAARSFFVPIGEQSRRIVKNSGAQPCPSHSQGAERSEGGRPNKSSIDPENLFRSD